MRLYTRLLRHFQVLYHSRQKAGRLPASYTSMIKTQRQRNSPVYLDSAHHGYDVMLQFSGAENPTVGGTINGVAYRPAIIPKLDRVNV